MHRTASENFESCCQLCNGFFQGFMPIKNNLNKMFKVGGQFCISLVRSAGTENFSLAWWERPYFFNSYCIFVDLTQIIMCHLSLSML